MTYLGYSAEHVGWLRDAMRRALDELRVQRTSDDAAATAMVSVRQATSMLEGWLPILDELFGCTILTEYRPVVLSPDDLRDVAALEMKSAGWTIVVDPVDPSGRVVSPAQAVALARALGGDDLGALLDTDDELRWLAERLEAVSRHRDAAVAFRAAMSGWAMLGGELARRHLETGTPLREGPPDAVLSNRVRLLDEVASGLALVLRSSPTTGRQAPIPHELDLMEPYAATLVVRHLGLSTALLVDVAESIMLRWRDGPDDGRGVWIEHLHGGDNTADLLFPLLIADPPAATMFLQRTVHRLDMLLFCTQDEEVFADLLRTGTDPAHVKSVVAGEIIVPLVRWLRENEADLGSGFEGGAPHSHALMGGIVAPWIAYLGPRSADWTWRTGEATDALRWVASDDQAVSALIDSFPAWQAHLATQPMITAGGIVDTTFLREYTQMIELLETAIEDAHVDDAAADRFWFDIAMSVGKLAVTAFVPAGRVGSLALEASMSTISPIAVNRLERFGIAPPTADQARTTARTDRGRRSLDRAVIATVAVVGQLIDEGHLPPDALDDLRLDDLGEGCTAAEVDTRLHEFITGLGPTLDPADYNALIAVRSEFLNQANVDALCRL